VIDVVPRVITKSVAKTLRSAARRGTGSPLTHRHDRIGHERVLIRRGMLPLDPEEKRLLTLRDYAVYIHDQPLNESRSRLLRRNLPLRRDGEWLAVKTTWVKSSVIGNEELPYKPALWRLSDRSIVDFIKSNRE